MDFAELLNYCKLQAINNTLSPTEESVYRAICRTYSAKFHVPLPQVYLLDPEHVLIEVYESQLEEIDVEENIESVLENIYSLEDPEYQKEKEQELSNFIAQAEAEEEERIRLGKPLHKAIKKSLLETTLPTEEKKPTGGKVDFSSLSEEG